MSYLLDSHCIRCIVRRSAINQKAEFYFVLTKQNLVCWLVAVYRTIGSSNWSEEIHSPMSHWAELADAESMRAAIPIDLNKAEEWKFNCSVCSICLHHNIFCWCDQLFNLNNHRFQWLITIHKVERHFCLSDFYLFLCENASNIFWIYFHHCY